MSLDRLWSGWRSEYIASTGAANPDPGCVFCAIAAGEAGTDEEAYLVWRGRSSFAVLNAYPYTSGHLLVLPVRHVGSLAELAPDESQELWAAACAAVGALEAAYAPEGVNMGANLGRAAGAGIPGHLHLHVLPRWAGDTNFMTSVAEARVLPEPLSTTWGRLRDAWPT